MPWVTGHRPLTWIPWRCRWTSMRWWNLLGTTSPRQRSGKFSPLSGTTSPDAFRWKWHSLIYLMQPGKVCRGKLWPLEPSKDRIVWWWRMPRSPASSNRCSPSIPCSRRKIWMGSNFHAQTSDLIWCRSWCKSCREWFITRVIGSQWRRLLSTASSLVGGRSEQAELTIFSLPRTHGMMLLGGKKFAGTRAGKQFYFAFDTELVVQNGCCLFRTDEAIITPDWICNECLVCAYDSLNREFAWVNRPYELTRNGYNAKMKNHRDKDTPRAEASTQSSYARARQELPRAGQEPPTRWDEDDHWSWGTSTCGSKTWRATWSIQRLDRPEDRFFWSSLSQAETIRKGKGRGKGRGKGSCPGGLAGRSTNAEDYIFSNKVEVQQVRCHFRGDNNIEGTHKCQSCFNWLGLMAELRLRYAGWKSRPRKPTKFSPSTRSILTSSRVLRGWLIAPGPTKGELAGVARVILAIWRTPQKLMLADMGS